MDLVVGASTVNRFDRYPTLKAFVRWRITNDQFVATSAMRSVVFEDVDPDEFAKLFERLDGSASVSELAALIDTEPETLAGVLEELERLSLLDYHDGSGNESAPSLLRTAAELAANHLELDLSLILSRLAALKVHIMGEADLISDVERLCFDLGIKASQTSSFGDVPADCIPLAIPASYQVDELLAFNKRMLDQRQVWMAVLPHDGAAAGIGPIFIPWQTACFQCFVIRRASNNGGDTTVFSSPRGASRSPMINAIVAGCTLNLLLDFTVTAQRDLPGRVSYITSTNAIPSIRTTVLRRAPRCSACSQFERIAAVSEWTAPSRPITLTGQS